MTTHEKLIKDKKSSLNYYQRVLEDHQQSILILSSHHLRHHHSIDVLESNATHKRDMIASLKLQIKHLEELQ